MEAKMQLLSTVSEIMPGGTPDWKGLTHRTPIAKLIPTVGRTNMHKALMMLVRDFCDAFGVVRNMSEAQMIEAAAMLLDECGDFRMEDYVMMFTLAKRGSLDINGGRGVMDRIDIELIGKIVDAYWKQRREAGQHLQEEEMRKVDEAINTGSLLMAETAQQVMTAWREETEAQIAERKQQEQQQRDEAMRARRDADYEAYVRLYIVPSLAYRVFAGERLAGKEQTFYNDNREAIDAYIAEHTAQLSEARIRINQKP